MLSFLGPKRSAILAAAGLALAGAAIVLFQLDGAETTAGVDLAAGERLYGAQCAACHGANLEGEPDWRQRRADGTLPAPPHDASGHTWHHPDQQLLAITKLGTAALVGGDYKTNMGGFADQLSDDEIRSVLGYIQSRWPEEIRRRQQDITARAAGRAE